MNLPSFALTAALIAALSVFTSPSLAQSPPKEETEAQALMRSIAEKTIIDRLVFHEADISEVVSYIRKKSIENSPEKDPDKKGLNFINRVAEGTKPISMDLRNVSLWVAIHKVAAVAGVEVTNNGNQFTIHKKGEPPNDPPATPDVAAFEKSAAGKRATGITLDRIAFSETGVSEACDSLKKKSKEADKEKKGVDISAEGKFTRTLSMDLRTVRLIDAIKAVAEVGGAEITVSGDKIILKPAKKTE